jgi:predicted RNA binding protein YcfA (HicA-like mRNA interferase family)
MLRSIIFSELEKLLLKVGFTTVPTAGSHKVFKYPSPGALVILPADEKKACVHSLHLVAVRRILMENGLIDRSAFVSFLEKVPS